MTMTDPIADLLTRMRNALAARHATVSIPRSGVKEQILRVMVAEGYLDGYDAVSEGPQGRLDVRLKYLPDGEPVIQEMKRVSRPGLRVYKKAANVQLFRGGLGTQVVSTSQGIMTGREARRRKIGGELIATIW